MSAEVIDSVVIGAGQAGLSASRHLQRRGIAHVVLDAERAPGGAWQHRSPSLTMADVHGVADLPDLAAPPATSARAARTAVPAYFAAYEQRFALPVRRPVQVRAVRPRPDGLIDVETDAGTWTTRTIVNATGTWRHPFVPAVPGAASFIGRQLHSSAYRGPGEFAGARVLVVGGGASAVQTIGELAGIASDVVWATRSEPRWASEAEEFDGRAAVARVIERVERGLAPQSVVSVTGLRLREQEQAARRRGWYDARRPMPARLVPDGAVWPDGVHERVDAVIWATGFRAVLDHLAPLRLREPGGGIRMSGTTASTDPRVQLVGYGPSASTIGANRAGRDAAIAVRARLRSVLAAAEHDLVPAGNGGAPAGTA